VWVCQLARREAKIHQHPVDLLEAQGHSYLFKVAKIVVLHDDPFAVRTKHLLREGCGFRIGVQAQQSAARG
jgi:hypothetical protein